MFDKLKTIVGAKGGQAFGNALATQGGGPNQANFQKLMSQVMTTTSKFFEEKEWQCPCGHKFRAPGEWMACAPVYCEVPTCPNPKFYLDGPGRALLEANPQGVKLQEVDPSKTLPGASGNKTNTGNGMGGRFKK